MKKTATCAFLILIAVLSTVVNAADVFPHESKAPVPKRLFNYIKHAVETKRFTKKAHQLAHDEIPLKNIQTFLGHPISQKYKKSFSMSDDFSTLIDQIQVDTIVFVHKNTAMQIRRSDINSPTKTRFRVDHTTAPLTKSMACPALEFVDEILSDCIELNPYGNHNINDAHFHQPRRDNLFVGFDSSRKIVLWNKKDRQIGRLDLKGRDGCDGREARMATAVSEDFFTVTLVNSRSGDDAKVILIDRETGLLVHENGVGDSRDHSTVLRTVFTSFSKTKIAEARILLDKSGHLFKLTIRVTDQRTGESHQVDSALDKLGGNLKDTPKLALVGVSSSVDSCSLNVIMPGQTPVMLTKRIRFKSSPAEAVGEDVEISLERFGSRCWFTANTYMLCQLGDWLEIISPNPAQLKFYHYFTCALDDPIVCFK